MGMNHTGACAGRMARSFILLLILCLNATLANATVVDGARPQQTPKVGSLKSGRLLGARPATRFDGNRCRGLADLGAGERPAFLARESGEWECSYLIDYPETSHQPSVFVVIRGVKAEVWSNFRLKLNFGSVLSRQELASQAAQLVQAIVGERIHVKDLAAMLAAQKDFTIAFGNIEFVYKRERMDETRFNLTGTVAN